MGYLTRTPGPPLAEAVEAIWIHTGYRPPHLLERVFPSGTVEMIVQLEDKPLRCYDPETLAPKPGMRGPLIVGARTQVQIIDTKQQLDLMGVHFRAGGVRALFAAPAIAFSGMDVPVDATWPGFGAELMEKVSDIPSPHGKLDILERMLLARLKPDRLSHPAVPVALARLEHATEAMPVGDLAKDLGLSFRRFIEVFTSHVGLTPKSYARIRRFQRALRVIHQNDHRSWADLAFGCGWYDQSHMIRDFKDFSGLTPAQYAALSGDCMRHIPVAERGQICPIPNAPLVAALVS